MCDIIYLKNETTYSNKEGAMAGVKGRSGGARPGAGRKPNEIERKHRTVYCNNAEFRGVKNILTTLKELDKANKMLANAKGNADEYNVALAHVLRVREEICNKKLGDLIPGLDLDKNWNEAGENDE